MSDGDIDYSKFKLLELEEALAGINRQRYPKNYANLRSTYEQRTAAIAAPPPPPPATATPAENAVDREPVAELWGRFRSRFAVLAGGAACFWWAYDLFFHTDSCPSGGKLIGDLVKTTCDNFGHGAAAGIPFLIGVVLVILAMRSRQRSGA